MPVGLDSSRAPSAADCDTRLRHGAEEERQRERRTDAHEDCHCVCRQMQAQKVQARMQKELSRGQNRCASARHQHETTCFSTKHRAPSTTNQGDACVRVAEGFMERLPRKERSDRATGHARNGSVVLAGIGKKPSHGQILQPNESKRDRMSSFPMQKMTLHKTVQPMLACDGQRTPLCTEERTDCNMQGTSTDFSTVSAGVMYARTPRETTAGKLCIEVEPTSKLAWISEELCIGCGICVKVRTREVVGSSLETRDSRVAWTELDFMPELKRADLSC